MNSDPRRATAGQVVLFVADSWEHVCPVVRVLAPAREAGVTVLKGNELEDGSMRVFPERVAEGDVVIIQRDFPAYEDAYEKVMVEARAHGKPVVYELDDLLFRLPDVHPDLSRYARTRFPILRAVLEADAVMAPTPTLCEYLRDFNPNTWLHPNYLVDASWTLRAPAEPRNGTAKRPVVVGYMGGHSHSPDLAMIAPVLGRLVEKYQEGIELRFWGVAPPAELSVWPNVEAIYPGLVDYEEFATYFGRQDCDIFIAPLLDSMFNRCKSPLKFLEYSTLGVPGVYSRIPPYEGVVKHAENGFLASNEHEWETLLSRLIEDAELRSRVGEQAQLTVRRDWLLSEHSQEWAEKLVKIAALANGLGGTSPAISVLSEVRGWHEGLEGEVARGQQIAEDLRASLGEKAGEAQSLEEKLGVMQSRARTQEEVEASLMSGLAEKERDLGILQSRVAVGERETQELAARLIAITSGNAWRLVQALRAFKRQIIPPGGVRDRFLRAGRSGVSLWRTHGFRALIRRVGEKTARGLARPQGEHPPVGASTVADVRPSIHMDAHPGELCPTPAIDVVVIEDGSFGVAARDVQNWCQAQTWPGIELVVWSRQDNLAWRNDAPQEPWSAPDLRALRQGLGGRYVCVASPDLLEQDSTFLEVNLLALETERLAFAVNVFGNEGWALKKLEQGLLPGDPASPLLRQVVRKDCLGDRFTLDVSEFLREGHPVIGKLIVHTANRIDAEGSLAFETRIGSAEIVVAGRHILGYSEASRQRTAVSHLTHPVDTVLAGNPVLSELPTVLVVLPFLAIGGAERLLLRVMRHLKKRIRFLVVAVDRHDVALGTTVDEFRQITPYVYNLYDYLESHLFFSFFGYMIKSFAPRSLYIANGATWIYDAISTLKASYPSIRTIDQVYHHQLGWIGRYDPAIVDSLDAHVGGNAKICRAYVERGARTGQVHLVEHGIEPDEVDPAKYPIARLNSIKDKLGIPGERRVVSFIGRLHPQKRPMDFVELARRFESDASLAFLMIGGGPLMEIVNAHVARANLTNLWRHSYYQPISDIYAISDAIVLPSEYEATPLVLLEGQAMGKPVVATDVGNNREVLEFTKGGQVADNVGDIAELASALTRALSEPCDPVQMRHAVMERFGMARIAEQYRQILVGD